MQYNHERCLQVFEYFIMCKPVTSSLRDRPDFTIIILEFTPDSCTMSGVELSSKTLFPNDG